MDIYLAGGYSGNLNPLWSNVVQMLSRGGGNFKKVTELCMDIFLVAPSKRTEISKAMELYLAGEYEYKNGKTADWTDLNILESYYYLRENKEFPRLIRHFGNFLLDSGAFTFMSNSNGKIDWDSYIEEFAAFINKWDINNFFELDIDSLVGLSEVERLRFKLEALTGKKPIPVWHKNRGKDYFIRMCENYPYVALGGIVSKEIPLKRYELLFPWFINEAHKNGCKIHGLGYTKQEGLRKYHFDSVDSTAWIYGNMSGTVYKFNPRKGTMEQHKVPAGKRLVSRAVALNNFNEWVRFQKYARIHL